MMEKQKLGLHTMNSFNCLNNQKNQVPTIN